MTVPVVACILLLHGLGCAAFRRLLMDEYWVDNPLCGIDFIFWIYRLERGWSSFNYLAGSETFSLSEVDDGEAFRETMDAMAIVGLTEMVRYLPVCPASNWYYQVLAEVVMDHTKMAAAFSQIANVFWG